MRIRFVLVSEGGSEKHLVPHLEDLCVRAGADEAHGSWPDLGRLKDPPGKSLEAKVRRAIRLEPGVNLVFAHRDADGPDDTVVLTQVEREVAAVNGCPGLVPVVPVQELEAWLLADPTAIRRIVGRPRGTADLGVPPLGKLEKLADPKKLLRHAICAASGKSGRHLDKVKRDLPKYTALLLQRLDIEGPVCSLPAWKSLVIRITEAIAGLDP